LCNQIPLPQPIEPRQSFFSY